MYRVLQYESYTNCNNEDAGRHLVVYAQIWPMRQLWTLFGSMRLVLTFGKHSFPKWSSTPKQTLSANGHKILSFKITIQDDVGRWRRSQASVYRDPKKQFRFSMLFLTGLPLVY